MSFSGRIKYGRGRTLLIMTAVAVTALAFFGTASAQKLRTGKPTAAVYVNGNPEGKDVIRNAVYKCLDKSGKYQMVNINAINTVLIKEQIRQSDKLTTVQVADAGKKAGAEFVCMVDIQNLNRVTYVSVSMVDVEGLGTGETGMQKWERNMELLDFIQELVEEMLSMDIEGGGARASSTPSGGGNVVKGTFTDKRDGKKYKTVKIGGKTWMAENLNYGTGNNAKSSCYNNAEYFCRAYGRLYTWDAARLVCPAGFHLPTRAEWKELERAAGWAVAGKKLKAKNGWEDYDGKSGNGTDNFGFSALPGGARGTIEDIHGFSDEGEGGIWWTATEYNSDKGLAFRQIMINFDDYMSQDDAPMSDGYSVRCVAD